MDNLQDVGIIICTRIIDEIEQRFIIDYNHLLDNVQSMGKDRNKEYYEDYDLGLSSIYAFNKLEDGAIAIDDETYEQFKKDFKM